MKETILLTKQQFESSSGETREFSEWYKTFRREFTRFLKTELGATELKITKNHFESSGFFKLPNNQIYYYHINDLRWFKDFMIRTAKSFEDYTGGSNIEIDFTNEARFKREIKKVCEVQA